MSIEIICMSFFIYSFLGWVHESTICSIASSKHCFVNRGFLLGPYCPIYGVGALVCYELLGSIESPLALMICAMILCSAIEYCTGYCLEKLFNEKWWDYSDFPFQLHGRICLYGALLFGILSLVICRVLQPTLIWILSMIEPEFLRWISSALAFFFTADAIYAFAARKNPDKSLSLLHRELFDMTNQSMETLSDHLIDNIPPQLQQLNSRIDLQLKISAINSKLKEIQLPTAVFRSCHYYVMLRIKEYVDNVIDKFN